MSGSSVLTYQVPRQHKPDLVESGPHPCDLGCGGDPEGEIKTKGFTDLKMQPRIWVLRTPQWPPPWSHWLFPCSNPPTHTMAVWQSSPQPVGRAWRYSLIPSFPGHRWVRQQFACPGSELAQPSLASCPSCELDNVCHLLEPQFPHL